MALLQGRRASQYIEAVKCQDTHMTEVLVCSEDMIRSALSSEPLSLSEDMVQEVLTVIRRSCHRKHVSFITLASHPLMPASCANKAQSSYTDALRHAQVKCYFLAFFSYIVAAEGVPPRDFILRTN